MLSIVQTLNTCGLLGLGGTGLCRAGQEHHDHLLALMQ